MRKPQGKKAKRQAVEQQRLKAKRAKGSTSHPSPSPLLSVCLDLYIVSDAADEVHMPSGDHPMGDHTADAASSPPGELSRVLVAIVTRELCKGRSWFKYRAAHGLTHMLPKS